jgi:hypothetical protein
MAIAFNAVSTSGLLDAVVTSLTFSHTPAGTDRLLLVGVRTLHGNSTDGKASGVTFDSQSMALHREYQIVTAGGDYQTVQMWKISPPTATTANVVVTFPGAPETGNAVALSFTGVSQSAPIDVDGSDASSLAATAQAVSVTTVAANAMVVSLIYSGAASGTLGAGPTQRDQTAYPYSGLDDFGASATEAVASASTVTHTWTTASTRYNGFAVSLREPVAAGDTPAFGRYRIAGARR